MKIEGIEVVRYLDLDKVDEGTVKRYWIDLVANGIGQSIFVPVIVARGTKNGKVLGITAAVHGNELNGVPVIQRLFDQIDVNNLNGTLIGVPVVNVPSVLNQERRFIDGEDLNRIMPGNEQGNRSDVYARRIMDRIISQFEYLIDLHTASFGRVNSYYIRADMSDPVTAKMANLQHASIIVDTPGADGTLRSAASDMGIKSITVEVGDPNTFQKGMIRSGLTGVFNVLSDLGMVDEDIDESSDPAVVCKSSYWIYADRGGLMEVFPKVTALIEKGQPIAKIKNVFGDLIKEYAAPERGIVIGRSTHPVNQTGGRIIHLGRISK